MTYEITPTHLGRRLGIMAEKKGPLRVGMMAGIRSETWPGAGSNEVGWKGWRK